MKNNKTYLQKSLIKIKKTITIGNCSASGFNQAKLNASQNITSDLVAQAMMDSISSQIQQLDAQSTQSNSASQTGTAKSTGPIQDLFDGITGLLSGLLGTALAAAVGPFLVVCCCCLCLCLCAFIGMQASKGSGNGNGGNSS